MELSAIIESILFVAEEPITAGEIAEVVERPAAEVTAELEQFAEELARGNRGVSVRRVAGGWRMYSHPEALPYLERFAQTERVARLSKAAMETLAVVAYKQPVSRGQVAEIRGVDSEQALRTLERRGLVGEIGRAHGPGQALLFGTTELFLEKLGIDSVHDLPPLADHVPPATIVDTLEEPFRPETIPSNDSTS